jgi:hypothetical protein
LQALEIALRGVEVFMGSSEVFHYEVLALLTPRNVDLISPGIFAVTTEDA